MAELPGGTVTFAFTDIEDSTELLKRLGEGYADVLTAHRKLIRESFSARDGIEIDTQGDAFFFVFPRARDALGAAVDAQRAHASAAWPHEATVRVRMGLHTGEPAVHEEGYVGLDVVRAARICTEGRGGHILLSETTRSLLGSGLPDGVSVYPVGQRHLRGIDEPERVFEVAIEGVEVEESEEAVVAESQMPRVPPPPEPPAPPGPVSETDADITRRFDKLGERLSAGIRDSIQGSLSAKLGRTSDTSAADDIASRYESLGDEINARILKALKERGIGA